MWRATAAGLILGAVAVSAARSAPLPIKAFFSPPVFHAAQLSPSGRFLAVVETSAHGDSVAVIDIATREKTFAMKARDGGAVEWVRWKGDDRLLTGLGRHSHGPDADADEDEAGPPEDVELAALDRDGSRLLNLTAGQRAGDRPAKALRIADTLVRDPAHVLVVAPDAKGAPGVWKVDVHSGSAEFVREGEGDLDGRLPRGAMIVRYDRRVSTPSAEFDVLGPAEGGRKAFVALQPRTKADGDTATIRIYDFAKKSFSEPVWPARKYDVSDIVYHEGDNELAGVCYTADLFTCEFKNAQLQGDYAKASSELGGDESLTPLSMSDDGRFWLFAVSGPADAGSYKVFDRRLGRFTFDLSRHPDLPSGRLGTTQRFTFKASDGVEIPGYLTRPPGAPKGPLPMLVMPHGGPEARDSMNFDIWTQFFATRGYLVFQPNFRGSAGYGRAFAEAGYGEWGGRIFGDITEGVRKLIADGQADPGRICIFGASFGGYAAMNGGAQTPELYKCIASFAGVADLEGLVQWEKTTKGHEGRFHYASHAIGDPIKDAAKLKATSPIQYVKRFRAPVLLIHGREDHSVPLAQSEAMEAALKKAGKDVRLLIYSGEGHADWSQQDEESALGQIAEFVQKNIAPATGG